MTHKERAHDELAKAKAQIARAYGHATALDSEGLNAITIAINHLMSAYTSLDDAIADEAGEPI